MCRFMHPVLADIRTAVVVCQFLSLVCLGHSPLEGAPVRMPLSIVTAGHTLVQQTGFSRRSRDMSAFQRVLR